jgi:hypothetical protein
MFKTILTMEEGEEEGDEKRKQKPTKYNVLLNNFI